MRGWARNLITFSGSDIAMCRQLEGLTEKLRDLSYWPYPILTAWLSAQLKKLTVGQKEEPFLRAAPCFPPSKA